MVIVDTSAWVEYFRNGFPTVVSKVDRCLDQDLVGIGDLVYCELMQGIRSSRHHTEISSLLLSLPHFNMVGFHIAEKSAANYRFLRSKGVTVRKTIDVLIGTFCAEHGFQIVHHDSDFNLMAQHIGLDII
ncbi:MAG: PIN domain nuclease [Deltaproteobacteria bacterium]|nr:PIN domain nuclease [Deltaproteobacteria bacterium]